jgi:hypothetical protein
VADEKKQPDPAAKALEARVNELLAQRQRQDVAAEARIPKSTFTQLVKGDTLKRTLTALRKMQQIEDALGAPHGDLLRAMGFVDLPNIRSARQVVETDSSVDPAIREPLLVLLDHYAAKRKPPSSVTPLPKRADSDAAAPTGRRATKAAAGSKAKVSAGKEEQLAGAIAEKTGDDPPRPKGRGRTPKT